MGTVLLNSQGDIIIELQHSRFVILPRYRMTGNLGTRPSPMNVPGEE